MPLRILIVEDFEKFRRYLCSVLEGDARCKVVGQACDGLEAVQKAAELKPDLILLDVGLPKLNGLLAAKQMRKIAPLSKILFVSQEFSFDVVEAALRSGALGYIHKLHVSSELLSGIEAVNQGRYFVSGALKEKFRKTNNGPPVRHEVQLYSHDALLMEGFADFAATELRAGKATIVAATELHRAGVLERLEAKSVDVDHAIATGMLIPLDAAEMLSKFMSDEMLDPDHFFEFMDALIGTATRVAPSVAVCGEIAPRLLAAGKPVQALRLEELSDIAVHGFHLNTLCGYVLNGFEADNDILQSICAEHSVIHSR
jgi:DNA-binding NarL/FixJ family response regulator